MKKAAFLALLGCVIAGSGCATTTHPVVPADLGKPVSSEAMESLLDQAGPMDLTTVAAADWSSDLQGLLNLSHPKAVAAGLRDRKEPIQLYIHLLKHPSRGLFMVDTGLSKKVVENPASAGVSWLVRWGMRWERLKPLRETQALLQEQGQPLRGVFMSHLHIDHIGGMPDIGAEVPIYTGPGEASGAHGFTFVTQGSTNRLLEGKAPLREFHFKPDPSGRFEGILDVFGDGSFFAIQSAGHTAGSLAFVARTPKGPVLLVGDTCHTRWGWDNGVEPGSFTADQKANLKNLFALKELVARHSGMEVRLGHQR